MNYAVIVAFCSQRVGGHYTGWGYTGWGYSPGLVCDIGVNRVGVIRVIVVRQSYLGLFGFGVVGVMVIRQFGVMGLCGYVIRGVRGCLIRLFDS